MMSLTQAPITLTLLIANVVISLYALFGDQSIIDRYSFRPHRVWHHREGYRLLSGAFLHGGLGHLLFNMITLFFFGPVLEAVLGGTSYLLIYFGAALTSDLWPLFKYREDPVYAAVGASGAISGVLFAFSLLFPLEKLYLFFIPIGIPAALFAVAFVAYSYYAANQPESGGSLFGRIAHEAHLGGALGGLLITILLYPRAALLFFQQVFGVFG